MDRIFWDQMASIENRMEAMFRSFGLWTPGRSAVALLPARPFAPPMDVIAKNGDVVYRLDLPGLDPAKDLTLTAEGGDLTVHGERHETTKVEDDQYYRVETFKGIFERHIPLPEGAPVDRIAATYTNGVLEIVVPNVAKLPETAKPVKIPVKPAATGKTAIPARS
jgi:HSP20 family protein